MLEKKAPCPICPYKLGMIKTLVSPCPQCRLIGYSFYYKHSKSLGKVLDGKSGKPLPASAGGGFFCFRNKYSQKKV